jgi:pyruvate dehydrogenase E2 component (dihydrolipoamide acetyltransferase)
VAVPDLGDFKSVEVVDVLVKPGDAVDVETPLITLETEKATMDVPSTAAGRVARVVVKKGDRVSTGSVVVELEVDAPAAESAAAAAPATASDAPSVPAAAAPASATSGARTGTGDAAGDSAPPREVEVRVPDLGSFKDVAIIDVLVQVGDEVAVDAALISLESDKAAMDVPSPVAGTVVAVHVKRGGQVNTGSHVATVRAAGAGAMAADVPSAPVSAPSAPPALPAPPAATAPIAPATSAPAASAPSRSASPSTPALAGRDAPARHEAVPGLAPVEEAGFARAHAGPSVRRLARELGVDLARVKGSGVKGRITHEDVKHWVKQALAGGAAPMAGGGALPRVPDVDFAKFGPVEVQPLTRIQRISGPRLHASWVNLPHVTQFDEADITDLEQTRVRLKQKALDEGIKLTPLAFILRAVAKTMLQFPRFNASLDTAGENLVFKKYLHLGFAADTPNGLVVPVVRDADRKDVYELARELGALSEKARTGKLTGAEMQGGCFTVSSLGGIGGTAFTPIINAPEVAILGISRSQTKPVFIDGEFLPRLMLPLSLSYDHRVIDGADAARFTTALAQCLADVRSLLEAVP